MPSKGAVIVSYGLIGDVLLEGGARLEHRGVSFVGGLLRDDLGADQDLVALVGDEREVVVGARVGDLLIELGRGQDREQLARVNAVALIDLDGLQVAGNLGVNIGLVEAANRSGQLESRVAASLQNVGDQHVRAGRLLLREFRRLAAEP